MAAMLISAVLAAFTLYLSEQGYPIGWSWIVVIGTVSTFSLGWLFGHKPEEAKV